MNKTRRNALNKLHVELTAMQTKYITALKPILDMVDELNDLASEIDEHRDAEQKAFDGMSEKKQRDDIGLFMQDCITEMETAKEAIDTFVSGIEDLGSDIEPFSAVIGNLMNAAYDPD